MKAKHLKTLKSVFDAPTRANIAFADIEALAISEGIEVVERAGSRVVFNLGGALWHAHRPHPGREAKKYQIEELRQFFERAGITPEKMARKKKESDV